MKGASHHITIEQKWQKIADKARDDARRLPASEKREHLMNKARQLEVAMGLNSWLSAPTSKPSGVKSSN